MAAEKTEDKKNVIIPVNLDSSEETGVVQITNNLLATIIKKYTLDVDGVVRFAPQGIVDGLATILSRKSYENSISIELTPDGAIITLDLNMRMGVSIPAVSAEVQKLLKEKIEGMTGCPVLKININVMDLEDEEDEPENEATVEADI